MSQYIVEITPEAEQDFIEIKKYIINQFGDYDAANNLAQQIKSKIIGLSIAPFAGTIIEIDGLNIDNLRSINIRKYRIFYYADEDAKRVIVTRIVYGRRDFIKAFDNKN